jgi:hypothetical protein
MGNLTRHADPGGAVGDVRCEEGPVGSDHTRGPVVSVVEEDQRPARRWPNPGPAVEHTAAEHAWPVLSWYHPVVGDRDHRYPRRPRGRLWCRGIEAHRNGARLVMAIRKPVQRLGASRVARRLPGNACRTRHLDGTPTGAGPLRPASPRLVPRTQGGFGSRRACSRRVRPARSQGRPASANGKPVMS